MGLYDRPSLKLPQFHFAWKQFKLPLIGIGAAIAVIVVVFAVLILTQPRPLVAALDPNPLDLSKDFDSYLTVTVQNTTGATAQNITVLIDTEASEAITIFPRSREISTLGNGENRTLSPFVISPNTSSEVYSGTYIITISTVINGQSFSEKVSLDLRAV